MTPPYDGKPCPMCPSEIRNLSATAHNLAWRIVDFRGDSLCKIVDKLYSLRRAVEDLTNAKILNDETPDEIRTLYSVCELVARVTSYPDLFALGATLKDASDAVRPLSDAHFNDSRHSHGA